MIANKNRIAIAPTCTIITHKARNLKLSVIKSKEMFKIKKINQFTEWIILFEEKISKIVIDINNKELRIKLLIG